MKLMSIKKTLKIVPLLVSLQLLAACGGGGESAEAEAPAAGNGVFTKGMPSVPHAAESIPAASSHAAGSSSSVSRYDNPVPGTLERPVRLGTSSSSPAQRVTTGPDYGDVFNAGEQQPPRVGEAAHSAASSSVRSVPSGSGYGERFNAGEQPPRVGEAAHSASSSSSSVQSVPSGSGHGERFNAGGQQPPGVGEAASSSASSSALPATTGSAHGGTLNAGAELPSRVGQVAHSAASSQAAGIVKPTSFASSDDALQYALRTGDASVVSAKQVTEAAIAYIRSPAASSVSWFRKLTMLWAGDRFLTDDDIAATRALNGGAMPSFPQLSVTDLDKMLELLDKGGFATTWRGCKASKIGGEGISCNNDQPYQLEFGELAKVIRTRLRSFDAKGTKIFGNPDYRLEQLLVLLGDKYRQDVSYGEHFTKESDKTAFLRALFSDAASYMNRDYNQVAKNLGSFSDTFPDGMQTIERELRVAMPRTAANDTPHELAQDAASDSLDGQMVYVSGLYVLPGRSVTLTRTDKGSAEVRFGINLLRDTTHAFYHLDRPTQLGSPRPALLPNQPLTVTNPYGGPLFLFIKPAPGQADVSVRISGVITHPVLRQPEDPAAVQAFQKEVDSTPTNWVIITTDMVTLHSTVSKFKKALSGEQAWEGIDYHGDLQQFVHDTWTYFVKIPYELAGFNSENGGFDMSIEVKRFCEEKQWDCAGPQHRRDVMQHVIADIPLDGGATGGNPYDQDWPFIPLGWPETHEVGHNLQRNRMQIYLSKSTEVSNNIFPLYKHIRYNQSPAAKKLFESDPPITGSDVNCVGERQAFGRCVFNILKQAKASGQAKAAYDVIWGRGDVHVDDDLRLMFYRQLVEFARNYHPDKFKDGWEFYTLLYLLDRDVEADRQNWAAVRNKYGFGSYEAYPEHMDGNDFMLLASSFILGRDMRPVFRLWGITWSDAASAQVDAYHFPAAEEFFFPMKNVDAYGSQIGAPVQVTPDAVYPTL